MSAINVTLPAFAAEHRAADPPLVIPALLLLINISCLQGAQQQTCRMPQSNKGTDRQRWTDGRWTVS